MNGKNQERNIQFKKHPSLKFKKYNPEKQELSQAELLKHAVTTYETLNTEDDPDSLVI